MASSNPVRPAGADCGGGQKSVAKGCWTQACCDVDVEGVSAHASGAERKVDQASDTAVDGGRKYDSNVLLVAVDGVVGKPPYTDDGEMGEPCPESSMAGRRSPSVSAPTRPLGAAWPNDDATEYSLAGLADAPVDRSSLPLADARREGLGRGRNA